MLKDQNLDWKSLIKNFNNFPKDGVVFRDLKTRIIIYISLKKNYKEIIKPEEI